MFTKTDIEKFYSDVEGMGLKYPVAAIAKATGFSKGNVSQYLNKKSEPSESFLNAFYEKVYKGSKNVPREKTEGHSDFTLLTMQALADLTKSNLNISESNKSIAAAHKDLVEMTKGSMSSDERNTLNHTVLLVHAIYDQFVEFVSEVKERPVLEIRKKFDNKLRELKTPVRRKDIVL